MSFTAIDLSKLPAPDVLEALDYDRILARALAQLQQRHPDFSALVESDPAFKVLEVYAYIELLIRGRINSSAKAVMLPYATGSDLDQLGSYWNVNRGVIDPGDEETIPPRLPLYENDDAFRYRIQLSMEGQTNAGTHGAYLFHALASDPLIKSASIDSPTPGQVVITLLSHEGDGTLSPELFSQAETYLHQSHIRQLTDELIVQEASLITYRIKATLFVEDGIGKETIMEEARSATIAFTEQLHKIGRLVPISGIYAALQQPGVIRVALQEPLMDIPVGVYQAAYCSAIELTMGIE